MVDVKLTFETNGGNPPVSPLCSGKQATKTLDKDDVGKTAVNRINDLGLRWKTFGLEMRRQSHPSPDQNAKGPRNG